MRKEVTTFEPYSCDCCGGIFGEPNMDTDYWDLYEYQSSAYTHFKNGEVSYEAKILGEYCNFCLGKVEHDKFDVDVSTVFLDRYDIVTPDSLQAEIKCVRAIVERNR